MANVDVACPWGGDAGIANGNGGIIVFVDNGGDALGYSKVVHHTVCEQKHFIAGTSFIEFRMSGGLSNSLLEMGLVGNRTAGETKACTPEGAVCCEASAPI